MDTKSWRLLFTFTNTHDSATTYKSAVFAIGELKFRCQFIIATTVCVHRLELVLHLKYLTCIKYPALLYCHVHRTWYCFVQLSVLSSMRAFNCIRISNPG